MNNTRGGYAETINNEILDPEVAAVFTRASDLGLSLRQIAGATGLSLSTVFAIKQGNRVPRLDTLRKLEAIVAAHG